MIICAGNQEVFSFASSIGVGLINSAYGLTKLCIEEKPESLIFVGSAGSYGDHKIFDIIESSSSSNIELSFLDNNSYTPIDNIAKSNNKLSTDNITVNSSNYITTNKDLSSKFNDMNIGIENMEYFSIVSVANKFSIPVSGIFIVTNYTNKDANKDFLQNHQEAMDRLVSYLKSNKIIT